MSIVSYAQNFEDVMLWRALSAVEHGFYIDIGAQDPEIDSVSLAFYDKGWRGLHIEPSARYSNVLKQARPDETVLQVAVAAEAGELAFYEFQNTGLSTGRALIADSHVDHGHDCIQTVVETITLDGVFDTVGSREVHWLKIDVEGMEGEVLSGWRDSSLRPWIIVIESTLPGSQEDTYRVWEPVLISKGYVHVYSDGINRFYVSSEHPELCDAFKYPPNVFDEFALSGKASHSFCRIPNHQTYLANVKAAKSAEDAYLSNAERHRLWDEKERVQAQLKLREARLSDMQDEHEALTAALHASRANEAELHSQLAQLLASRSWRITAPFRKLADVVKHARSKATGSKQSWVRLTLRRLDLLLPRLARFLSRYPKLRRGVLRILGKMPWLHERLANRLGRYVHKQPKFQSSLSAAESALTPRARMINRRLSCGYTGAAE